MDAEVSNVNMMDDEPEENVEAEAPETDDPEESAAANVTQLPQSGMQHLRMLEAMLFASARPLSEKELTERMPKGVDVPALLADLKEVYAKRGVVLDKVADKWVFRTASDLNYLFQKEAVEPKKLSKAAIETLAIIAYHQPVTRAEIEEIRGVTVSKGTLDLLLEVGWIRLRGRRRTPGRPITYGTSEAFLEHFGLENVGDLPGLDDLKAAGLLEANLPPNFSVPGPSDELSEDEDPLEDDEDRPDLLTEIEAEAAAAMDISAAADAADDDTAGEATEEDEDE
jgi:segregation and condensation protein B